MMVSLPQGDATAFIGISPKVAHGASGLGSASQTGNKRQGELGAGRLKAVVWTLILAACAYVSVRVIPVYVNEYEFQDGIQTIARFATVNRQGPDQIRDAIVKEAEKEDLPVRKEDIKVRAAGGNVNINVDYSVTVDLHVYQWTLNFHPTVTNNALF
jgi:cell division protein FtsL